MKTMKKILCTMLVVILCLTSAPLQGFVGLDLPEINFGEWFSGKASAIATSGKCGPNVTYTYNNTTKKLVISGTGDMTNYSFYTSSPFYKSDVKSVVIEDSVTSIGDRAFESCRSLTSITIGGSVTSIGDNAFYYCTSLTSITIPDSVTSIGDWAFEDCDSLTSITIGGSVTSIGDNAFRYCDSLTSITIGGSVTSTGNSAFAYCDSLTSITLGDSVTSIGDSAFGGCDSLTSITIPDSVTSIGDRAFADCNSLTSITLGDSVTSIGDSAFGGCDSLTSITIPDSVTSIGGSAFYCCYSLTSITLGDSVTSIGDNAFAGCDSLTSITVDSNNKNYSNDEYGVLFNKNKTSLILYPRGNPRTSYVIPDSVTSIGDYAFQHCDSLTSITIPDSVTSIGFYAFYYCDSLTSITIGDSVTSIGRSAFEYCDSLTSITIPDSVTSIAGYAFYHCFSLTSITLGDSVTSIGMYAFEHCDSLTSITIPDSVTSIGDDAFYHCDSLTSITVDSNNKNYSNDEYGVLFNKNKTSLILYPMGNPRTSYVIPDSVTSIGYYAFAYCDSLTSITIGGSVISIGYYAFCDCDSLTSITIPDSVTSIGGYAFRYCDSLTSITIGGSVTSIAGYAFFHCFSLTSITLGDSVTSIGDSAFGGCDSLTSITIPDSVTSIGDYAFYDCDSLTDVYYQGTEEQWEKITIYYPKNEPLKNATIHYNYLMPDTEGNDPSTNIDPEKESYIQQHLLFRKGYYNIFAEDFRFATLVWENMNNFGSWVSEIAYDIIEGALELVSLQFLDGLEVAANPYDVILLEFLASDMVSTHFSDLIDSEGSTMIINIAKKIVDILGDESEWLKDFDLPKELKSIVSFKDYSNNALYKAIDKLVKNDKNIVTNIFKGFECCTTFVDVIDKSLSVADYFVEMLRYTYAVETFKNSSDMFRSVLTLIASEMEINNPLFASHFNKTLEFYDNAMTYESVVDYVIDNKVIGGAAGLLANFSSDMLSKATTSFIMKAFKVGKDAAKRVNAALWAAQTGFWASNLLTGNDDAIQCRRMLRANHALDVATYNVMERTGKLLDRDETYTEAVLFDSCFNIFKFVQLYSLSQYKTFCETMNSRVFKTKEAEYEDAKDFVVRWTGYWQGINCHYVNGTSSFRTDVDTLVVECPTDIFVYRKSDNKLVASVVNNKSNLYDDAVSIACIGEEKSFAAASIDDYRVEILATDNGTMDVTYNSYKDFTNTSSFMFDDFVIDKGETYEVLEDEKALKRDDGIKYEDNGKITGCSCNCHKSGIAKFFFNFILFFQKLFRTNQECKCGVMHY